MSSRRFPVLPRALVIGFITILTIIFFGPAASAFAAYSDSYAQVTGYQTSYVEGDHVRVTMWVYTATPGDVQEMRLGVNRAGTDTTRYRGTFGWFKFDPRSLSSNWKVLQHTTNSWFAWYNDTNFGNDHTTPFMNKWEVGTGSNYKRFVVEFELNDYTDSFHNFYGNIQNNDLDTYWGMGANSTTWSSGWINQDTNFGVRPKPVVATPTIASSNWFIETDANGDGLPDNVCDVNDQGRGSVTLTWPQNQDADGYDIYLNDGGDYQRVGRTLASNQTTWSSSLLGIYPKDSEINGWPADVTGNPFYRAQSPSGPEATITPSGVAGTGLTCFDGTYLYVRRYATLSGPDVWTKIGSGYNGTVAGQNYGTVGPSYSAKLARSAFLLGGSLFNGYIKAVTSGVASIDKVTTTGTAGTLSFTKNYAPLDRATGAPVTAAGYNVILCSYGSAIYSVAATTTGYKVREYSCASPYTTATFVRDYTIAMTSHSIGGAIATDHNLYLLDQNLGGGYRVTRVVLQTSPSVAMRIVNEWIEPGTWYSGCYDATNNLFWMGNSQSAAIDRCAGVGLDLRDSPTALYAKTDGTSCDSWTNYEFVVVPYSAGSGAPWSPADSNCPKVPVTLDNRTVHLNAVAQHSDYDLGSFAGTHAAARLDTQSLTVSATDLEIATYGPRAAIDRFYNSTNTDATTFATGWRFSFERNLVIANPTAKVTYCDEQGANYVYTSTDGGATWVTPEGSNQTLAYIPAIPQKRPAAWHLVSPDNSVVAFTESGQLTREWDRNNNATVYAWAAGSLTITAANGQQIVVAFDGSNKIVSATYTTSAGTRQVNYTNGTTPQVTYFPGTGSELKVDYAYTSSRLTGITARDWPANGTNTGETFAYTSGSLTGVFFADYNATTKPDAHATIAYPTGSATVTRYGTINGVANTPVVETYTIATTGTTKDLTLPSTGSGPTKMTYSYTGAGDTSGVETDANTGDTTPCDKVAFTSFDTLERPLVNYDEVGSSTSVTYDSATGQVATVTDPLLTTESFVYDSVGDMLSSTKPLNTTTSDTACTQYTYDAQGRVTQENKLISGTPASGTWATTDYSNFAANGEPQTIIHRGVQLTDGGVAQDLTEYASYDAFGNLLTKTDTTGTRVTETDTYDIAGNLITSVDARGSNAGATSNYTYDKLGNVTETYETNPNLTIPTTPNPTPLKVDDTLQSYDALGRVVTETARLWVTTSVNPTTQSIVTNKYDGLGNEITSDSTVVGATGTQDARFYYDARGQLLKSWNEGVVSNTDDTRATIATYDAYGNELSQTDPGNTTASTCTYDAANRTTLTKPAGEIWTSYGFDKAGHVVTKTVPTANYGVYGDAAAVTSTSYDAGGREISTTDPNGTSTAFAYDELGRATGASLKVDGVSAPPSTTVQNTLGWELRNTDADGVVTTKVYDPAGNVLSETVGGKTTSYTYDDGSNVLTETDPDGRLITNTYDYFANLTEEKHTVSGSDVRHIDTTYDSLGRTTAEEDVLTGVKKTWVYPANTPGGISETLRYDSGAATQTTIAHDARQQETTRTTTATSGLTVLRTVNTRDAGERITKYTMGSIVPQFVYDSCGRLKDQYGTGWTSTAATVAYAYDANTARKTTDNLLLSYGGNITGSYAYDDYGRLVTATLTGVASTYDYDGAGNLIQAVDGGTTSALTYDAGNHLTQMVKGTTTTVYGWDTAKGWRTSQGPSTNPTAVNLTYTGTGALATYTDSTTGHVVNASYAYDAVGQRRQSTVTLNGTTTTTTYKYADFNLLELSATSGSSSWKISYLYDENGVPYAGIYRDPATSTAPILFGIVTDDRGDVVELLDAGGNAFAAYRYDAWGYPTSTLSKASTLITDPTLAANIANRQILRYAGYAWDVESGLYYCSARSYDPATRQWISKDPQNADGEESAYQYCSGDPIGGTDPSGLKREQHKAGPGSPVDGTGYYYYTWSFDGHKWSARKAVYETIASSYHWRNRWTAVGLTYKDGSPYTYTSQGVLYQYVWTPENLANYNCLAYALGINGGWIWPWGDDPTNKEVTTWLKARRHDHWVLCKGNQHPDIASYGVDGTHIGHFARIVSGGIISKWGRMELLKSDKRNPFFDISGGYGHVNRYYKHKTG